VHLPHRILRRILVVMLGHVQAVPGRRVGAVGDPGAEPGDGLSAG